MYWWYISGFKETAYLYALTSASLVHSFSRACSTSQLDRCTCDQSHGYESWKWGGCADNIKFGRKFTQKFIKARRWNQDPKAVVDQHNSNVGIKVSIIYKCRWLLSVDGITVLCHFHKNVLMPVVSCLTSLIFYSLFHVISIKFCPKNRFLKK